MPYIGVVNYQRYLEVYLKCMIFLLYQESRTRISVLTEGGLHSILSLQSKGSGGYHQKGPLLTTLSNQYRVLTYPDIPDESP